MPGLPQGVARVAPSAALRRAAASTARTRCSGTGQVAGQRRRFPTRSASTSRSPKSRGGRLRSARRSARRSCRSDTGSTRPIGPGQQLHSACSPSSPSAVAVEHRQQRPRPRAVRPTGAADGGGDHGHARRGQRPGQRRAARRTERTITAICDHGTPSIEMGAAQRVDDQRGLGVRRRGHPHGHRARRPRRCPPDHGPLPRRAAGGDPGDGARHRGCAAVRLGQRDRPHRSPSPRSSAGSAPR